MGYSHRWRRRPELPEGEFKKAVVDCEKVCDALPIPLGDGGGEGAPEFSDERICFNGHVCSESFARQGGLLWPTAGSDGEEWEFEHDPVTNTGTLRGSDVDWQSHPVTNGRAVGLILNENEISWLRWVRADAVIGGCKW